MILLTHPPAARALYYGDRALAALERLAPVRLNPSDAPLEGGALIEAAAGARIIVADRAVAAPAALFAALPELVAFVRCAVDVRTVDIDGASAAGVLVTHASPGFATAVSELVLGVVIDLHRSVSRAARDFAAGKRPAPRLGREVRGSTVGIIGMGTIGRALAPVLLAMGATVISADPTPRPMQGVSFVALAELLRRSDTVICLAAATPETAGMLDARAFALTKRGAFLVNASRGELVDEAALGSALESGQIGGAALDVGMGPDQMPSPLLTRRPDVVATPHVGGLTMPAIEHQAMETTRQVADILKGELPAGCLNPAGAHRFRIRAGTGMEPSSAPMALP